MRPPRRVPPWAKVRNTSLYTRVEPEMSACNDIAAAGAHVGSRGIRGNKNCDPTPLDKDTGFFVLAGKPDAFPSLLALEVNWLYRGGKGA